MRYVGYPNGLGWSRAQFDGNWENLQKDEKAIYMALEDNSGRFLGEAKIAFPGSDGFCQPDLKLLPEHWGKGMGFEAWQVVIERTRARWPEAGLLVTPNIENNRAIELYLKLGFEFDGENQLWEPPNDNVRAVPVRYRKMVKKGVASVGVL
jgi:RimJ/RimL family protein N-acetyltransferase